MHSAIALTQKKVWFNDRLVPVKAGIIEICTPVKGIYGETNCVKFTKFTKEQEKGLVR